jgi:DNA-binding SARP family transcriptional activator
VHIKVLGQLTVSDAAGHRLPADELPRRARQLLGVLAARHDRIQSKDALADAVWGDEPPANHVAALEHYVSVVRRRLQPGRSAAESFIVTRSGGYFLDTTRVQLDLADLRLRARRLDSHPPSDPGRLQLQQEILDLAADLPFPEDAGADWTRTARNDVCTATLSALLELSEAACDADPGRAMRLAQEAIELDPYLEQAYRAAMNASVVLGRPDEALRWYERCRQVLNEELGVAPAVQTTQLRQAVLTSRRPAGGHPGEDLAASRGAEPHPVADTRPTADAARPIAAAGTPAAYALDTARNSAAVFVGRQQELELLMDRVPAPVVHLVGPPGAGKSALLTELRRRAPGRVGIGHCAGTTGALRLTWLRTALAQVDAGSSSLTVVDQAMAEQRPLSLEDLEVLAAALDRPEPVILAVDDASDLDDISVAELAWLGRRCASLSVVLTYCYPSVVNGRPIAALGTPIVLRLAPLADEDVKELGDPDMGERTGGIPALVGAAHRTPAVTAAVAMQIARSRTRWMPEAGWEVLRLSAALGPLRAGELAALTGRPLTEILVCVDQLIHAHLLSEGPDGQVQHRSGLIRAAVAEQVSSASGIHLREQLAAFGD